jgi:hypothetical protein
MLELLALAVSQRLLRELATEEQPSSRDSVPSTTEEETE